LHHNKPRIIIYHAGQCDPKKCTGIRLTKQNRSELVRDMKRIPRAAVVLNPVSERALSQEDRTNVLSHGLVGLDCSWKTAEDIFTMSTYGFQRALPYLLAANPINTYKPIKLSTAEAISAALYIVGLVEEAEDTLSVFKWGHSFLSLNREWLDAYQACKGSSEVVTVQKEIMDAHTRVKG
jgi:pre-rRNA-processing protein TSR3